MRATFITILLVISSQFSFSTERGYKNYCYSRLNFSFCYNSSQPDLKTIWYYKGVSSALNDYIEIKIGNSELKDKVFEIEIGCGIFGGHPSIEISKNSSKNFVSIHGLTDLKYLKRIVEYFAHPDYESFVIQAKDTDELMRKNESALATFNSKLDNCVPNIKKSPFKDKVYTIFKLDKLRVDYSDDELYMYVGSRLIGSNFKIPCPVKLTDKYIVNVSDTLKVFNSLGLEINQFPTNKSKEELDSYFDMNAFSEWMNFYHFNKPIISYSAKDNKFFRIKR